MPTVLRAGRDLDALVARAVMGKVPCDKWVHENLGSAGGPVMVLGGFHSLREDPTAAPCEHEPGQCYPQDDGTKVTGPPRYSTDIAAAWKIVEKFRIGLCPGGVACCIELLVSDGMEERGDSFCRIYSPGLAEVRAQATTIPMAICLAALKAHGYE